MRSLILVLLAAGCVPEPTERVVRVIESAVLAERSCGASTGVGPAIGSNGGVGVAVTSSRVCIEVPVRRRLAMSDSNMVCVLDAGQRVLDGQRLSCRWRWDGDIKLWTRDDPEALP